MANRFELPSELNIYNAQSACDALLAWVLQCHAQGLDSLEVCAGQVCEVDGSGLQLLASMAMSQPQWRLVQPSPAFADACRTLGFAHWLPAADEPSGADEALAKRAAKSTAKTSKKTTSKATSKVATKAATGAQSSSPQQESAS